MEPRHLLLAGGGHSHVGLLRAFIRKPPQGLAVTLVSEQTRALYSGALPGHLAGRVPRRDMEIDLAALARAAGARFLPGRITGLDLARRRLGLADGSWLDYVWLSLNLGLHSADDSISEAADSKSEECPFLIPVKPLGNFLDLVSRLRQACRAASASRHVAVIGGGPAGVELALALRSALAGSGTAITLVSRSGLLPRLNAAARRDATRALARHGIGWRYGFDMVLAGPDRLLARDGQSLPCDHAVLAMARHAPGWLAAAGLACAPDGRVLVAEDLSVPGHPGLFASGDCAKLINRPLETAGVHAVRQGPVLAETMRRLARGEPPLAFRPQRTFLTLLDTGDGRAIAARGAWFAWEGRTMALWKRWLDRRFVAG